MVKNNQTQSKGVLQRLQEKTAKEGSKAKNAIECGIVFLEVRLFLENHSLEFHDICHENNFRKQYNTNFNYTP